MRRKSPPIPVTRGVSQLLLHVGKKGGQRWLEWMVAALSWWGKHQERVSPVCSGSFTPAYIRTSRSSVLGLLFLAVASSLFCIYTFPGVGVLLRCAIVCVLSVVLLIRVFLVGRRVDLEMYEIYQYV